MIRMCNYLTESSLLCTYSEPLGSEVEKIFTTNHKFEI